MIAGSNPASVSKFTRSKAKLTIVSNLAKWAMLAFWLLQVLRFVLSLWSKPVDTVLINTGSIILLGLAETLTLVA